VDPASRDRQSLVGAQGCASRRSLGIFYSVFSIGPLILIAIAIAGLVFGAEAVRGQVFGTLKGLLGDSGSQAIEAMLKGADRPREGVVATVIGVATLVFAAVGVVVQLKDAFNTVWEVETTPGSGIWRFVRSYVLSLAGVLSLGFLLLVSLLVTAALGAASKYVAPYLPEAALQIAGFAASFAVISLLFAMMFKWLPDTKVEWRDVWLGAVLTAALFEVGKFPSASISASRASNRPMGRQPRSSWCSSGSTTPPSSS